MLKLEKIWTKVEKDNVRLSRINGMELDSTQSLPSNIRRVKSEEEKSQRTSLDGRKIFKRIL